MRKSIHSKESVALTKWLREQREHRCLTQRQLAKALKIHHSIVGKIETGERRLDVIELVTYCNTLGTDPHGALDSILNS